MVAVRVGGPALVLVLALGGLSPEITQPAQAHLCVSGATIVQPAHGDVVLSTNPYLPVRWTVHLCGAPGFQLHLLDSAGRILAAASDCNPTSTHRNVTGAFQLPALPARVDPEARMRLYLDFCLGGPLAPFETATFALVHV